MQNLLNRKGQAKGTYISTCLIKEVTVPYVEEEYNEANGSLDRCRPSFPRRKD